MEASKDPGLSDYLRQRILLAAWTRAIILKNEAIAQEAASGILRTVSDTAPLFEAYLKAQTAEEREKAATFAMLKMPYLSPYLVAGVPDLYTGDDGYYLESAWWCVLAESEYDQDGKEVPKQVGFPSFLQPETLEAAKKERAEMISLGDAKTILGKRVTEWANKDQNDPRLPEALFIAVKANESYKYGCNGWEHDEKIQSEAETLLLERYGGSPWAAKLRESRQ